MRISTRKLSEIKKILLDPHAVGPRWTYLMIRNLPLLSRGATRGDLTILRPTRLGQEFNKTFGHIHRPEAPETYKVLFGKALFLLQRMAPRHFGASSDRSGRAVESQETPSVRRGKEPASLQSKEAGSGESAGLQSDKTIKEIKLILVSTGETVTVPSGWYHTTINLGKTPLILLNWLQKETKNDYSLIEEKKGFGYYVVADDNGEYKLVQNGNYSEIPKARFVNQQ